MTSNTSFLATPSQVEGPFYPVTYKACEDNNLIIAPIRDGSVETIVVAGHVFDLHGQALPNVLVEIWQADENGRYDHPGDDKHPMPINQHFNYWGKTITDAMGRYFFKTIKPAPYNDEGDWRTPHIHFKLHRERNCCALTTQLYFIGEDLNAQDNHLGTLPASEQELLLTQPELVGEKYGFDAKTEIHEFNIFLK